MLAKGLMRELQDLGAVVIGPEPTIAGALTRIADEAEVDIAILDVNLGGEISFPVAEALIARDIPFIFSSGYEDAITQERYPSVVKCDKPYVMTRMIKAIKSVI